MGIAAGTSSNPRTEPRWCILWGEVSLIGVACNCLCAATEETETILFKIIYKLTKLYLINL